MKQQFPVKPNTNGPIAELGYQMRLRAEAILKSRVGTFGRTRGLHVIAMVERTGSSDVNRKSGVFSDSLREQLAAALKKSNATLQPEEARFKEINTWHDPVQIRRELRSNMMRLVDTPQKICVMHALDLHVLHHLYAHHRGYPTSEHLGSDDFYFHAALRAALGRVIVYVPELALWSQLRSTVKDIAEPKAA